MKKIYPTKNWVAFTLNPIDKLKVADNGIISQQVL
jgi:hypothetical protein